MAAAVGKFAANKLLRKHMGKYKEKKVETGDVRPDPPTPLPSTPSPRD